MVLEIRITEKKSELLFFDFLKKRYQKIKNVDKKVASILKNIQSGGDKALSLYAYKFDKLSISETPFLVSSLEISQALNSIDSEMINALNLAYKRIFAYHERQFPKNSYFTDSLGVEMGWRWNAIESVGLYIPGSTAIYPSSVLMSAIPAKVAGVKRIVMTVSALEGKINPLILAAAHLVGITEIYRVGGVQAIGALAYGTETIQPVSKIVGPGNSYVASAKKQVFGVVGIDIIAGPSEILIIADETSNPEWVASDLLAQAEHDQYAQSILITNHNSLVDSVKKSFAKQIKKLSRSKIAKKSWNDYGAIVLVNSIKDSIPLINYIAPEHLELCIENPENILSEIYNAGAIFLGPYTPEAIGDYIGGPNHVLPTFRSSRFSSPLSVLDYMKRTSILKLGEEQFKKLRSPAIKFANTEGLDAHKNSLEIRLKK